MTHDLARDLDAVATLLGRAQRVLFITGAGISADSGLPTYRGLGGLYNSGLTEEGMPIEDALSGDVLYSHPHITWKYLSQIEVNCRAAQPNAAHLAIAELERRLESVLVFTQNVDGLHAVAGSRQLIEIHGNFQTLYCTACPHDEAVDSLEGRTIPPRCPRCGGILRPEIVLFGESLPEGRIESLIEAFEAGFDMVFVIGTSSTFPYIVQPVLWAVQAGIPTVEINPGRTQLSQAVRYHLPLGAAEAMTALLERMGSTGV